MKKQAEVESGGARCAVGAHARTLNKACPKQTTLHVQWRFPPAPALGFTMVHPFPFPAAAFARTKDPERVIGADVVDDE
eukprot:scaffold41067_cov18-Tisochrysis_lutea.AAC.1